MKRTLALALTTATLALTGTFAAQAADLANGAPAPSYEESDVRGGVKIGYLECEVGGGAGYVLGSAKEIDCTFHSSVGRERTDHYSGAIRKMGVDLGFTTRSKLVWGSACADSRLPSGLAQRSVSGRQRRSHGRCGRRCQRARRRHLGLYPLADDQRNWPARPQPGCRWHLGNADSRQLNSLASPPSRVCGGEKPQPLSFYSSCYSAGSGLSVRRLFGLSRRMVFPAGLLCSCSTRVK